MRREVLIERFFTTLISGDRQAGRAILDEVLQADVAPDLMISRLFWPVLEQIDTLHRNDQLSDMAHHFAVRMLRMFADQVQLRLERQESQNRKVLLICGPDEPNELAAQMAADLMEANGLQVYFAGGGIANDELVAQAAELKIDVLCVFGGSPSIMPYTRLLIDRMHDIGLCPNIQIAVGGGIFNRAEGLAEEIGADLWASTPEELVKLVSERPSQRMNDEQRTVGRKRRIGKAAA